MLRPFMPLLLCIFCIFLFVSPTPARSDGGQPPLRIAVLGDSLTAGYGLSTNEAFPAQLEAALRDRGLSVRVINAGVSGDTTAGGLARLDWTLLDEPQLVVVELGGNDALRGLPPAATAANLDAILTRLRQEGIQPLLAGIQAPRNLGPDYYNNFDAIYPRLATEHRVPLYPFFLAGVAGDPALNQADGIHPNARGVAVIVENILPLILETINGLSRKDFGQNVGDQQQ